jgi:hypothetical protein
MRHEEPTEEDSAPTQEELDVKCRIFMIRIEYQVKDAVTVLNLPDSMVAMCLRAIADTYDSPRKED